ncbi:hypothetical protein CQW23_07346 [Capsicum baccatum]|uniref:Ubiquitin-like protease family profile domain-containing protein n=1 Tax=Capsicum baccatum TaxID=33114 RepID=A0A2G2X5V1_CAPBA|nr:hypothetical protein CQW23_07346 [Capsicum baccatum]
MLSNVETMVIIRLHFDLVDSGRYKDFPWGSLSFKDLARSLNNRLKAGGKFYLIQGMPLAIQVVFKNIEPTKMELAKLEIPQKNIIEDECSLDSDDDFQDPLPKKINGHSKKKQKGCTDLHLDKTNIEIDSQYLIPDELLKIINLDYNLSEKIVHHDVRRESITIDPLATREEEPNDEHFNDKKSKSIVQDHCQENKENVGSRSKPDMHEEVDLERCIFLYDSYESSGHYPAVLAEIEKLVGITPLCLQQYDFYVKKVFDVENHPRYKDKDSSDMFDGLFQENLPQKLSGSLDCGLYMVTYVECLSYDHKVLTNEFDSNAFHKRYAALLWNYGTQKQEANSHNNVEAPLRPARQSRN